MTHADPAQAAAELVHNASGAFMQTQCLYTAAKLGVADALAAAGGAASAAELGEAVGAKPDQLERVLRFLVTMGIFDEPSRGAR
jgi:phage-related tail protein